MSTAGSSAEKSSARSINPHISVDCVIFGFSTNQLKVLLIERAYTDESGNRHRDLKLPGDFITPDEHLDRAAARILEELTGLHDIYLRQFEVFGHPNRISRKIDLDWLLETTGLQIHRVVTTAYYALINISESNRDFAIKNNARWIHISRIPPLAFDHLEIIRRGLKHLQEALRNEPVGFELLPAKFTIRQLQTLYEVILDCKLDNRNFRKKVLGTRYLVQLDEKQAGVPHKPAYFYRFDRNTYMRDRKDYIGFNF
ncbi:MAG TPA: NUDIX domain-containing protein [Bacteroides sp.]|nr:NUDIX domain-containing protein [Bacteroides sp.]